MPADFIDVYSEIILASRNWYGSLKIVFQAIILKTEFSMGGACVYSDSLGDFLPSLLFGCVAYSLLCKMSQNIMCS